MSKDYITMGLTNLISDFDKKDASEQLKSWVNLWNDFCESSCKLECCILDMKNTDDVHIVVDMGNDILMDALTLTQGLPNKYIYSVVSTSNWNHSHWKLATIENTLSLIKCHWDDIYRFIVTYPHDYDCDIYQIITEPLRDDLGFIL